MPPSGYLYVNDTSYGMLPISYNITTTGAVFNPGSGENIWTYSGTKVFLGFSTTQGAIQPDQQYTVGQSGTTSGLYENIYLYSVEGVQNETYITSDIDLTSVADAIRTKGGTSASLIYPAGYVNAINALPTGTLQSYKSAIYTSPGTATILPDSGYVGIEEISVEYSPSIYDGAYHTVMSPPVKGDIINIDMNGDNVSEQYLVLKITGTIAEVFGRVNLTQTKYANSGDTYEGSLLDTYLNTTWYNSLSSTAKSAIVDKMIYQESWACDNSGSPVYTGSIPSGVPDSWQISLVNSSYGGSMTRHVYAPSVQDVIDFYGATSSMTKDNTTMTKTSMVIMFPDMSNSGDYVWLRSKESRFSNYAIGCQGYNYPLRYVNTTNSATYRYVRPAFQIDLSKIDWSFAS